MPTPLPPTPLPLTPLVPPPPMPPRPPHGTRLGGSRAGSYMWGRGRSRHLPSVAGRRGRHHCSPLRRSRHGRSLTPNGTHSCMQCGATQPAPLHGAVSVKGPRLAPRRRPAHLCFHYHRLTGTYGPYPSPPPPPSTHPPLPARAPLPQLPPRPRQPLSALPSRPPVTPPECTRPIGCAPQPGLKCWTRDVG